MASAGQQLGQIGLQFAVLLERGLQLGLTRQSRRLGGPTRPKDLRERQFQHDLAVAVTHLEPVAARILPLAQHVDADVDRRLAGAEVGGFEGVEGQPLGVALEMLRREEVEEEVRHEQACPDALSVPSVQAA